MDLVTGKIEVNFFLYSDFSDNQRCTYPRGKASHSKGATAPSINLLQHQ